MSTAPQPTAAEPRHLAEPDIEPEPKGYEYEGRHRPEGDR